ncbi:hypothetical protein D3C72_927490 [compost metagenome]
MARNFISLLMVSNPWFGIALLFVNEETYSEVWCKASIKSFLFRKGVICNAFSFPISVLQISEMACRTVLNSKSCNVLSVMLVILSLSEFYIQKYKKQSHRDLQSFCLLCEMNYIF